VRQFETSISLERQRERIAIAEKPATKKKKNILSSLNKGFFY